MHGSPNRRISPREYTPEAVTLLRDEIYAEPKGIPLRYDLFRPPGEAAAPLVVCIHGGGWISGEKEDMHEVAVRLAERGYAAACIQYRLAPLHPFPAAVEDVWAFVTFARSEADNLGVDPDRFASIGISAGGHLAAMAGLSKFPDSRVQAVVDICGITDLTDPHGQHFPVSLGFLEQFMGVPFAENPELYRLASPLYQVFETPPPFFIAHGEADDIVPVGQSTALHEALQAAGGTSECHLLPNEGHGFTLEAWNHLEGLFLQFLERTLLYAHRP